MDGSMANVTSPAGLRGTLWASLLTLLGCASTPPIEGVVRPRPGEAFLERLPGPMPGFGPFDSYSDALIAACPRILSKPHATAGRAQAQPYRKAGPDKSHRSWPCSDRCDQLYLYWLMPR